LTVDEDATVPTDWVRDEFVKLKDTPEAIDQLAAFCRTNALGFPNANRSKSLGVCDSDVLNR